MVGFSAPIKEDDSLHNDNAENGNETKNTYANPVGNFNEVSVRTWYGTTVLVMPSISSFHAEASAASTAVGAVAAGML